MIDTPRGKYIAIRVGDPPQRLCSLSSGLPWLFIPEHGVEDGEDLPCDGDENNHFRLPRSEQALIEARRTGL
jgi:hypothetical protein